MPITDLVSGNNTQQQEALQQQQQQQQQQQKHKQQERKYINCSLIKSTNKIFGLYHKRPCISRTFFHKIEAKNQGCGLSTETSVVVVLKGLINIHKTSLDV